MKDEKNDGEPGSSRGALSREELIEARHHAGKKVRKLVDNAFTRTRLSKKNVEDIQTNAISSAVEDMSEAAGNYNGRWVPLSAIARETGTPIQDLVADPDKLPDTISSRVIEPVPMGGTRRKSRPTRDSRRTIKMKMELAESLEGSQSTDGSSDNEDTSDNGPDDGSDTTVPLAEGTDRAEGLQRAAADYARLDPAYNSHDKSSEKTVAENLKRELSPGPADTTATYDFHSLRMALPGMWGNVIDPKLREQLEELTESMVVLWHDHDIARKYFNLPKSFEELEELDQLIELAEDVVPVLENASAIPPEVGAWYPGLFDIWDDLSAEEQQEIKALHWIFTVVSPQLFEFTLRDYLERPLEYFYEERNNRLNIDLTGPSGGPAPIRIPVFQDAVAFFPVIKIRQLFDSDYPFRRIENISSSVSATRETDERRRKASVSRLKTLLKKTIWKKHEKYGFDVFYPDSYNFGTIVTYRQEWQNTGYQVGDLVSTLPLAPGERRTISVKKKTVTRRHQKEIEKSLRTRRGESEQRSRAEDEIVRRAKVSTDFSMTAANSTSLPLGLGSLSVNGSVATSNGNESSRAKKTLRESVRKSAMEYRNEHHMEVTTESEVSSERTEESIIANTNNEITVTYLLYELQQRFSVTEKLHEVTPVVLIGLPVPRPNVVDEAWILEHEWILRRVLLDDTFEDALDHISGSFPGDELAVEVLRAQWKSQISLVETLKRDLSVHLRRNDRAREALIGSNPDDGVGLWAALDELVGGGIDTSNAEQRRDAAQTLLDWAREDLQQSTASAREGLSALIETSEQYIDAVRDRLNRRMAIDQLIMHLQQNILHYMQAIWSHQPDDQRFMRLYDMNISAPRIGGECVVVKNSIRTSVEVDDAGHFSETNYIRVRHPAPTGMKVTKKLHQIADLSQLLGFKANYAIFPLLEGNGITEFMMQDYLHAYYGIYDPDPEMDGPDLEGARDLVDLYNYDASGAFAAARNTDINIEEVEARRNLLIDVIEKAKADQPQEIVVPTSSLFMEALPGNNTLLEDFKLLHRAEDVRNARLQGNKVALENIRKASRIVVGDLGDPDIEKNVLVRTDNDTGVDVDT